LIIQNIKYSAQQPKPRTIELHDVSFKAIVRKVD
jgi:hypothetical protein